MRRVFESAESLGLLSSELKKRWATTEILAADLAARFPKFELIHGWVVKAALSDEPYDLIVAVDRDFPWSLPIVSLPERVNGISYPHVEVDGRLCLVSSGGTFKVPVGIEHVEWMIQAADDLLAQGRAGENDADFFSEAQSYWSLVSPGFSEILLISNPPLKNSVWWSSRCGGNYVVADSRDSLIDWLKSGGRKIVKPEPALVLVLPTALHPRDYPLEMRDLLRLITTLGAQDKLHFAFQKWSSKSDLPVVIAFSHEGSIVLLGAVFMAPSSVRVPGARGNGIPGFRPAAKGVAARVAALSQVPVRFPHLRVIPTYREFLHRRTVGDEWLSLLNCRAAILGCGAIGGQLAVQLAQAGVGKITLVDPDRLDWRNVGRHVLGGESVGQNKAEALAKAIRHRFPDAKVTSIPKTWEACSRENSLELDSADILISVTGEAASNVHLDYLSAAGDLPPIVFGWLEPFGVAAHSVFRHPNGGGLISIADSCGLPTSPVVDLETAPPLPREPSCGAFYQPYSSLSVLSAVALIGELVIDALLGRVQVSCHRIWVGNVDEFTRNGLSLTPYWHDILTAQGYSRRYDEVLIEMGRS